MHSICENHSENGVCVHKENLHSQIANTKLLMQALP